MIQAAMTTPSTNVLPAVVRQLRNLHPVEAHVLDVWGAVDDDDYVIELVIRGRPVSSKNARHPALNRKTGKMFIAKDAAVAAWMNGAIMQLKLQWRGAQPIPRDARLRAIVIGYESTRQHLDLDNSIQGALDALQLAGVIENDKSIRPLLCDLRKAASEDEVRIEILLVTDRLGDDVEF